MKITLQQILDSQESVQDLVRQKTSSAKMAYRLMRNLRLLDQEYRHFADARNKLFETYATEDDAGNLRIDPDDEEVQEKWRKGLDELLESETEINLHTFSIEEIEVAGLLVSAADLYILDFMLTDEIVQEPPEGVEEA